VNAPKTVRGRGRQKKIIETSIPNEVDELTKFQQLNEFFDKVSCNVEAGEKDKKSGEIDGLENEEY
jgi:hypothetical protein